MGGSATRSETERSRAVRDGDAVLLTDVNFGFRRSDGGLSYILRSLALSVQYGQVVGIVGRNAAGKSTLLNVIRGELLPQGGSVSVGGSPVSRGGRRLRLPVVSLVSQRPDVGLAPSMTVYENFVLASRASTFDFRLAYQGRSRRACCDLVRRANLGLEQKLDEQVRFLSGGQQQALSVLLALRSPEGVLLMDEPTASLDPVASVELFGLAVREARASHAAVVVVSHRLRDLIEHCDRIIVLHDGTASVDIIRGDLDWSEEALLRHLVRDQ